MSQLAALRESRRANMIAAGGLLLFAIVLPLFFNPLNGFIDRSVRQLDNAAGSNIFHITFGDRATESRKHQYIYRQRDDIVGRQVLDAFRPVVSEASALSFEIS